MKILPIRIKLLSPLFNYSKVTNKGAITSDFIGDLALTYALNRAGKSQPFKPFAENFYQVAARAPNYVELRELDYYFTVAKPIKFEMTGIYIRNTLFNVDNFPDQNTLVATGKNLFKNYFRVQGIRPDSEFSTCLLSKDSFHLKLPCTIRLGTGRECLALLEKDSDFDEKKDEVWLNAFALKWVFQNLQVAVARLTKDTNLFFEYKLENYIVMKRISLEQMQHIFGEIFQ